MWPNLQETADLVTFTEEILNGKLHFFVQCISRATFQKFCFFFIVNFEHISHLFLIFLLLTLNKQMSTKMGYTLRFQPNCNKKKDLGSKLF